MLKRIDCTLSSALTSLGLRSPCSARLIAAAVLLLWFQGALAAVSPWVKLDLSSGSPRFATEVAGIPGESIIDTGATINSLNIRFLNKHNLELKKTGKVRIAGVHETTDRPVYGKVPGKVFGSELVFQDLVGTSFAPPDTQLLLGAGFLGLFIFQFDYPNSRMRVLSRDAIDLKKVANLETKRDQGGGQPIVKVGLDGEKNVWLVLDTGSTGGLMLERKLAKKHKWLERYPIEQGYSLGVNAGREMERFNLPSITFGPFELGNTLVSVPKTNAPLEIFKKTTTTGSHIKRRSGKAQGLLGYDVLKHFVLTIDYKTGRAHVAEPERLTPE